MLHCVRSTCHTSAPRTAVELCLSAGQVAQPVSQGPDQVSASRLSTAELHDGRLAVYTAVEQALILLARCAL